MKVRALLALSGRSVGRSDPQHGGEVRRKITLAALVDHEKQVAQRWKIICGREGDAPSTPTHHDIVEGSVQIDTDNFRPLVKGFPQGSANTQPFVRDIEPDTISKIKSQHSKS